jgi:transposase-like protein
MIPFPADEIHDEDSALAWWDQEFADCCESLSGHVDGAALVRIVVGSIRDIRSASLNARLTVSEAARETGYCARQVRRWLKDGKILNLGTDTAPRVRRGDLISHKKCSLPLRSQIRIMETAQDIARSVANSKSRNGDG